MAILRSNEPKPRLWNLACAGLVRLFLLSILAVPHALLSQDFTYTINNGTITITAYNCSEKLVIIPEVIDGLPVTSIGNLAFANCSGMTSLTIPDSVTSIGSDAFWGCGGLTNGTIGNGVTSIGFGAFGNCSSLVAVRIGSSVTNIANDVFEGCTSLAAFTVDPLNPYLSSVNGVLFDKNQTTLLAYPWNAARSYTIPSGVTAIRDYAFYQSLVRNITMDSSVTSIGDHAFDGSHLTSITIPDSVMRIGFGAFWNCNNLTNAVIGSGLVYNYEFPFFQCPKLKAITVDPLNSVYRSVDGVLFDKSQSWLIQYPLGKAGSYTVPNGVVDIRVNAFYRCGGLTAVTIPDGVASIGTSAFAGCTKLASITIPESVTFIGDSAFAGSGLISATIPNNVTNIGIRVFFGCAQLTNVTLGKSITSIGEQAFQGCENLVSLTIPSGVTSIWSYAFWYCYRLTGLYFQGNAPSVGPVYWWLGPTTIYYLPGTTGWRPTFDGLPTALWTLPYPVILDNSTGFGINTNGFGFTISWATNASVAVEASTNLTTPSWSPVSTNTLVNGSSSFSDPEWTNYPTRFYRLRSL